METLFIVIMTYLIGVLCSYFYLRKIGREVLGNDYNWTLVIIFIIISVVFSWLCFIITIILERADTEDEEVEVEENKPPTWL